jgi:hypothetical protein
VAAKLIPLVMKQPDYTNQQVLEYRKTKCIAVFKAINNVLQKEEKALFHNSIVTMQKTNHVFKGIKALGDKNWVATKVGLTYRI